MKAADTGKGHVRVICLLSYLLSLLLWYDCLFEQAVYFPLPLLGCKPWLQKGGRISEQKTQILFKVIVLCDAGFYFEMLPYVLQYQSLILKVFLINDL